MMKPRGCVSKWKKVLQMSMFDRQKATLKMKES